MLRETQKNLRLKSENEEIKKRIHGLTHGLTTFDGESSASDQHCQNELRPRKNTQQHNRRPRSYERRRQKPKNRPRSMAVIGGQRGSLAEREFPFNDSMAVFSSSLQ